jgi:hypothetical protein
VLWEELFGNCILELVTKDLKGYLYLCQQVISRRVMKSRVFKQVN